MSFNENFPHTSLDTPGYAKKNPSNSTFTTKPKYNDIPQDAQLIKSNLTFAMTVTALIM